MIDCAAAMQNGSASPYTPDDYDPDLSKKSDSPFGFPEVSRQSSHDSASSYRKLDAANSLEDDDCVEMVPMSVSSALFGRWKFPWSRSTSSSSWDHVDAADNRPSNESLLSIAFITFMGFTICQTVAAIIAKSEAMMGDSAAMFVDALTYLFNYIAERRKKQFDVNALNFAEEEDPERAIRIRERAKRKTVLQMELIPPLISVSTLVVVTAFVLRKAIRVLILDVHRDQSKQANPNLELMFAFSTVNLCLDLFNVFCFAKAKHAMGYETTNERLVLSDNSPSRIVRKRNYVNLEENDRMMEDGIGANGQHTDISRTPTDPKKQTVQQHGEAQDSLEVPPVQLLQDATFAHRTSNGQLSNGIHPRGKDSHDRVTRIDSRVSDEDNENETANLNMCSAYTHVFADTLRSIAVVIAAILAELVDGITPEEADATAAVVVSGLILLSLIPLLHGLVQTFGELRAIRAEEQSEAMFPQGASPTLFRMTRERKRRPTPTAAEVVDFT